jgi:hypothetical protein
MGWISEAIAALVPKPNKREAFCSFCGAGYLKIGPLVEGPRDAFVCRGCCTRLATELGAAVVEGRCGFCRKHSSQVGRLVRSDTDVTICSACVELATSILEQEQRRRAALQK